MTMTTPARLPRACISLAVLALLCSASLVACASPPAEVLNGEPVSSASLAPTDNASQAVVQLAAHAPTCSTTSFGTGLVVAPQRVLATAHVVAGADRVVITDAAGDGTVGTIVYFDPRHDLALIAVPGVDAAPLRYSTDEFSSGRAAVVSYRTTTGITVKPVTIESKSDVLSTDIYQGTTVTLNVWDVEGDISPGDSGAPLVTDGGILGLIFAESQDEESRGYALTLKHLAPVIERAADYTIRVDTGACLDR